MNLKKSKNNEEQLKLFLINPSHVSYMEIDKGEQIIPYKYIERKSYSYAKEVTTMTPSYTFLQKLCIFLNWGTPTPKEIETKTVKRGYDIKEKIFEGTKWLIPSSGRSYAGGSYTETDCYYFRFKEEDIKKLMYKEWKNYYPTGYEYFLQENLIYHLTTVEILFKSGKSKTVVINRNDIGRVESLFGHLLFFDRKIF